MEVIGNFQNAISVLQDDKKSQLFLETRKQHIKLAPKYMGNLKAGIGQQLSASLSRHDSKFDGFPVAYSNVKVEQARGKLISDQSCIHFDVLADFIVFRPTIGCKLKGTVNKISKRHLGCLVHGHFNAWVPQTSATEKMAANLLMGAELEFSVQNIEVSRNVLSIKGKLEKILNNRGAMPAVSIHPIEMTKAVKKQHRQQIREEENRRKKKTVSEDEEKIDKDVSMEDHFIRNSTSGKGSITDSSTCLESVQQITAENITADLEYKEEVLKHKKKKKKEKKYRNIDGNEQSANLENTDIDTSVVQDTVDTSMNSFTQELTNTEVDTDDRNNNRKKKKKQHKKRRDYDTGDKDFTSGDGEVQRETVVNGELSDTAVVEKSRITDTLKKSRKRYHEDESFTKLKSGDRLDQSESLVQSSPAKKAKKFKIDSGEDSGSHHSKKLKKKEQAYRVIN